MKRSAKLLAILLLPVGLAACGGGEGGARGISFTNDPGIREQPFPKNYHGEVMAFLRAYINNPVGVRDASMAEPVERTVGGRLRYVSCVRYTAKDTSGKYYLTPQEIGISYVDGRLDRAIDNTSEACAGADYKPFPDLEKMTR